MKQTTTLRPGTLKPPFRLYPEEAAFMPRPSVSKIALLGVPASVQDTVTTTMMGALDGLPTVRHRGGATPEILEILFNSGVNVFEDMRLYETPDEAQQHAADLAADGRRLVWPYPPEDGSLLAETGLITPALWHRLNCKENLAEIVPPEGLAKRRIVRLDALGGLDLAGPVFLKAGGDAPTGGGYLVRCCETPADLEEAITFYRSLGTVDRVIVEEALDVLATWCVSLSIEDERVRFIGAAEQLFDAPARQSGSLIDPLNPLPRRGRRLALRVGEAARMLGFRGLGGMDIGVTRDGRAVMFDPNFRIQASSQMVCLYESAARRTGLEVCQSFATKGDLSIEEIWRRLRKPADQGWFIAMRLIDGAILQSLGARSQLNGVIMGQSREETQRRHAQLKKLLES